MQGRRILLAGLRWRVGNGESIRVTEDPWIPQPHTFKTRSRHPDLPLTVADLIDFVTKVWRCDLISRVFDPTEARLITSMPISQWGCPDRLMWHFHKQGVYTVRSGYDLALYLKRNGELGVKGDGEGSRASDQTAVWKGIWRLRIPPKLRTFIWKACRNALAMRHHLIKRRCRNALVFTGNRIQPCDAVALLLKQVDEFNEVHATERTQLPQRGLPSGSGGLRVLCGLALLRVWSS
ncbi:unnamed protein product [Prunus brigantina]